MIRVSRLSYGPEGRNSGVEFDPQACRPVEAAIPWEQSGPLFFILLRRAHRIREAKKREPLAGLVSGTVEVDETYVGGKPRKEAGAPKGKHGRASKETPVVALV